MASYTYPNSVYDRPVNLLAALGSWWADKYASRDQVAAIIEARAGVETQAMFDMLETICSMSRFTVPIYHTATWYPLYLRASQRNTAQSRMPRYDQGVTYDGGGHYDVPVESHLHAFPLPADLVSAPIIVNRFTDPTLTQTDKIDYQLVDGQIIFQNNPFTDPRVASRPVYDGGTIMDTEAVLWVFRGEFDWSFVYKQFGYAIGMQMASSVGYRKLMNTVYDAITGGTTTTDIINALSAMTGVPLVREASETVVDIVSDDTRLLVITDQHTYAFSQNATPVVVIGDTVHRGQALTNAFQVYDFNQGNTPADLHALAVGPGFLATCFYADLIFENKDVPLLVETDHPSGYTKVRWGLGGFKLDADHFFEELHARGIQAAEAAVDECEDTATMRYMGLGCDATDTISRRGTLAHLLDIRTNPVGEPTQLHLPPTINPLKFLIQNVLRNNVIVVRVAGNALGPDSVGIHNTRLLRKVIPPNTAMILLIDLTVPADSVTVELLQESINLFDGMAPLTDTVSTITDSVPTIRLVGGNCH